MRCALFVLASLAAATAASEKTYGFADENGGTTGGEGGSSVYVTTGKGIHQAICDRPSKDTPLTIYVSGIINHANTAKTSGEGCGGQEDDTIELKEISHVSIIGHGDGVIFDELGIHIRDSSNIILRNLNIRNVKKSGSPVSNGGDAIGMEVNVHNIWVDHCTLEASGGEDEGYDSLIDMKAGTNYVTVSYCVFKNSGRGGLVGSSDTDLGNGPVTFHHNYYTNIDSRTPLLRAATAHSYNNYFNQINSSGMNPRIGGKMRAERNYFKNGKNVLGTFYTDKMGYWHVIDNIFDNCQWSGNYPAGPNVKSTTSISIGYSYIADDVSCVPDTVLATAGADNGLKVTGGSCSVSGTPSVPTPPVPVPPAVPVPPPTVPVPLPSAAVTIKNGHYTIRSKYSGLMMDVAGSTIADGANVHQWNANGHTSQQWWVAHWADGYHRIVNTNSLRVLQVSGSSVNNGGNVVQSEWTGEANQLWEIYDHNGYYAFVAKHSGKAIDVWEGSKVAGGNLAQYNYHEGDNQLWSFTTY